MAALYPLTLDAWNGLLGRINSLASFPPEGCDPVDELPLVSAPHKWSIEDITAAQNKLTEICSDNTFTAAMPGGKWRALYIDELDEAVDNGWCNCEPPIPCCIPQGEGTIWIEPYSGSPGYWVTCPYWQVIEQYLYANITYASAEAALPEGIMAHLVQCYGSGQGYISHSYRHAHWVNCIEQDYWLEGGKRGEEHWYTCGQDPDEVTYLGRVPVLTSSYQSSTVVGPNNYYDQPAFCSAWHYDYMEGRYYQSCLIGYFEVDVYVYDFAYWSLFQCPA
jgi:hypothetical protein